MKNLPMKKKRELAYEMRSRGVEMDVIGKKLGIAANTAKSYSNTHAKENDLESSWPKNKNTRSFRTPFVVPISRGSGQTITTKCGKKGVVVREMENTYTVDFNGTKRVVKKEDMSIVAFGNKRRIRGLAPKKGKRGTLN